MINHPKISGQQFQFKKPILVYLPCYNCEKQIIQTLSQIPKELYGQIECLVVDNHSADRTVEEVEKVIKSGNHSFPIHLYRSEKNLGYAGSQKTAYAMACLSPSVRFVAMLHGDGQYPPILLNQLIACHQDGCAVVNGYRSKKAYPDREETPLITYLIIKTLNFLESFSTGFWYKEWHSGFVLYSTEFLREVPLTRLSETMHIDAEFLMCAGVLKKKTSAIPIYKRYKDHEAFGGVARLKYIGDVFKMILRFRQGYYHRIFES